MSNSGNRIDTDLVPGNIRNWVNVFGVVWTHTGIPSWWFIWVWSKVILTTYWATSEADDLERYYYLFEATNHLYIVWIFNWDSGVSQWNSKVWIWVMNKSTWETKVQEDYYNWVNGGDWWAANRISYDDSTWDFYYTYENPVPTVVRKFTYSTATWSNVWALSGTTTSMTWNFFVTRGTTGMGGNIVYGGKTYTIYLEAKDVGSVDQCGVLYIVVS